MKLVGSIKNNVTKEKNGKNLPHLKITEVVLKYCNIVKNDYEQDSKFCLHLFLISHLVNYWIFHTKNLYF